MFQERFLNILLISRDIYDNRQHIMMNDKWIIAQSTDNILYKMIFRTL